MSGRGPATFGLCSLLICAASAWGGDGKIAVVAARVYTMDTPEPLMNATVLVEDGTVTAMGPALDVPLDFEVVEGDGLVVTPGLFDAYTRIGLDEIDLEPSTVDSGLGTDAAIGPAFDVQYALNPASTLVAVNRAGGVTHAVSAPRPGPDPLAGMGAAIRLTGEPMLLVPQVAMFGALGADIAEVAGGSRAEVVGRLRYALARARRFNAGRYEPDPGGYGRRDMAAIKALRGENRLIVMEAHRAVEIREALRMADDFDLRLVLLGASEAWQLADAIGAARVPVIVDPLANLPRSFDRLGARLDNPARLHAAGVTVAFTAADSHNARLIRQGAGNAVAHGMPWYAALHAITRAPVEIYGLDDRLGRLAVGGPANLVVWSGDPLEVTTWARRVMADGRWVSGETRQTRLMERYRHPAQHDVPFGYR